MIKILMTGAGAPGGPGILKALRKNPDFDITVADADEAASGRFLGKRFLQVPYANAPSFVSSITHFCREEGIDIVFPLVTRELFKFAAEKGCFSEAGVRVIVSDEEELQIANDKSRLYTHLRQHDILTPEFEVVSTAEALEAAVLRLGYPGRPVVIKPSVSNGSRGVRILTEEIDAYDLLFNHKPSNYYSTLPEVLKIIKGREIPEMLVSEHLPGEEYTIDTMVKNGIPQIVIPRLRQRMIGGISVKGRFEENREIIDYCHQIIESMDLHGPIGIQVKRGADGRFKILEINPRIQGTSVAAIGAGINLPEWAVLQELGRDSDIPKTVKWGTAFSRYYEEVFY